MRLEKDTIFMLGNRKVIMTGDAYIPDGERGYFILDFWEPCDYEDLDTFPVAYVRCENDREFYVLKKDNIIIGSEEDICLI
ncbi:MAG: hypothetical protein IJF37_00890 [Lachnospiraceae bacterium]|nr:hypothetical protein [Lachnospiraceae bacterium]